MESEKSNVIHLLGGSFVLDFHSHSQELKKMQRESTREEKNFNETVTKGVEKSSTVKNCETYVPRNAEEQTFLRRSDDHEAMDFVVIGVTLFSIVSYIGHLVSDVVTAGILFHRGQFLWAGLSLGFTILPIIAINAASLIWYFQNSLNRDSPAVFGWRLRIFSHCILLGMVCRNVDILINGFRANKELKKPPSFLRGHYFLLYREQRRVTAFLTLIQCFLQDAPQFSLQVYIWTVQNRTSIRFFLKNFHYMQYVSIAFSLVSLCYSVVSYHQTLRYTQRHVLPMNFSACIAQFTWRLGTTGSRLLVIMFSLTAYPYATMIIIAFHWALMIIWLMTQQIIKHPLKLMSNEQEQISLIGLSFCQLGKASLCILISFSDRLP
ncbi:unnamed protein product [Allacma fusca]|uniref:XK-related protein n=1 Tax=Allacma fusca TaxID=39272 RepID=A0A8J2JY32_9HEXA|nr:unnamed protein product [Allacma fusca]